MDSYMHLSQNFSNHHHHETPNNRQTSELYKHVYQTLNHDECLSDDNFQISLLPVQHIVPTPHRNNLKPIDSPLRRPRSTSEDEISDLDEFQRVSSTKCLITTVKKTKTANFSTINQIIQKKATAPPPPDPARNQHYQLHHTANANITNTNPTTTVD
ncbi:unnamed protein product [Rotaria magnacalcarata]|nr:unnamed protein product [Rotaria magnacalcarata]CAF2136061.1 unnamed protein product [Rotaria magnacalcarata]